MQDTLYPSEIDMKNSEEEKKEKESLKNNNLHLTNENKYLQEAISILERRLSYFLRDKFGRKSGKISPEDLYFGLTCPHLYYQSKWCKSFL